MSLLQIFRIVPLATFSVLGAKALFWIATPAIFGFAGGPKIFTVSAPVQVRTPRPVTSTPQLRFE